METKGSSQLSGNRCRNHDNEQNMIIAERLTLQTVCNLVSLHEHAVFRQGVIWNLDSFDPCGRVAEVLAQQIISELENEAERAPSHNSSIT